MIERAYALRDARENERRKIVEEKTQQQWRNACDDVRILDSKALTHYMVSHVLEISFKEHEDYSALMSVTPFL